MAVCDCDCGRGRMGVGGASFMVVLDEVLLPAVEDGERERGVSGEAMVVVVVVVVLRERECMTWV